MNTFKERPILFSAPMVRALLSGAKTQTRRVITPQPHVTEEGLRQSGAWQEGLTLAEHLTQARLAGFVEVRCPYGEEGSRLWVRETFYCDHSMAGDAEGTQMMYHAELTEADVIEDWREELYYRADGEAKDFFEDTEGFAWSPSIHMPRWASRILLEITSVRVERLQDISVDDALAEGIPELAGEAEALGLVDLEKTPGHEWDNRTTPENYALLWDTLNGKKHPWSANPWVWVVSFKQVTP